jgi:hypothetical protein
MYLAVHSLRLEHSTTGVQVTTKSFPTLRNKQYEVGLPVEAVFCFGNFLTMKKL